MVKTPHNAITYEYPLFVDYIQPNGTLTIEKECHACFYYGMLAFKARGLAGDGIDSQIIQYKVGEEIPAWYEPRDEELARSVALIYGLESPDEFLRFKKQAWAQAKLLGIEIPPEVFQVRPGQRTSH